tara:strand:- start:982 stop:1290 length:309 start_codon:yes stop_codon:yes gene_type:complete
MTHFDYITKHMLPGWVESWTYNFRIWADLMTGNYKPYVEPWGESPERDCYEWFWTSINLDDIYTKEFLEDLMQRMKDVESGTVKTYPLDDVLKIWGEDNEQL